MKTPMVVKAGFLSVMLLLVILLISSTVSAASCTETLTKKACILDNGFKTFEAKGIDSSKIDKNPKSCGLVDLWLCKEKISNDIYSVKLGKDDIEVTLKETNENIRIDLEDASFKNSKDNVAYFKVDSSKYKGEIIYTFDTNKITKLIRLDKVYNFSDFKITE